MAVTHLTAADKMAKYLKRRLTGDPRVVGLWSKQWGPEARVWLVVDAESLEEERAFRALMWDVMDEFPDELLDFYVGNVRWGDKAVEGSIIPADAKRSPL